MNPEARVLELLSSEFAKCKLRNRSYSLRAFAKRLRLQPSAISGLLTGKRRVTRKLGQRILISLGVAPEEINEILAGLKSRSDAKNFRDSPDTEDLFEVLPQDQLSMVTDWWNLAVYLLVSTDDFQEKSAWISERLGIDRKTVRTTIERLLRIGLLARDPEGKLVSSSKFIRTPSDIPSFANRLSHLDSMELAAQRLEQVPHHLTDYSSISMPIDPVRLPEAKKRLREFRRELCLFLQSGQKKTEVYRLNMQVFPLSLPSSGEVAASENTITTEDEHEVH